MYPTLVMMVVAIQDSVLTDVDHLLGRVSSFRVEMHSLHEEGSGLEMTGVSQQMLPMQPALSHTYSVDAMAMEHAHDRRDGDRIDHVIVTATSSVLKPPSA